MSMSLSAFGGLPVEGGRRNLFTVDPSLSSMPLLLTKDPSKYVTDPVLKRLEKSMIKDTPENREYAFWKSSIAQSFAYLTSAVIIGDGIKIKADSDRVAEIVERYNQNINVKGETIEDFIRDYWIDQVNHAFSLWRIHNSDEYEHNVDIQRIDPKTIRIFSHPTRGWLKFIQQVSIPQAPRTKREWYALGSADSYTYNSLISEAFEIIIPNEKNVVMYSNIFRSPPIASVLHWLEYKRWIAWFIRKFAEKYWSPPIIAYVGDPKSNTFPTKKRMIREALDSTSQALVNMRNFGVTSLLGHTKVEQLKLDVGKSGGLYVDYIDLINKEVMFALFGSMGIRASSGGKTEGAIHKILEQGYLRFIKGVRRTIEVLLTNFYEQVLLPSNNVKYKGDVKIAWSPLRFTETLELMRSIEIGSKVGVFKDAHERRRAAESVFSFLHEPISDQESKKLDKIFMDLNAPSRSFGDNPGNLRKVKNSLVENLWKTANREHLDYFDSFRYLLELSEKKRLKVLDLEKLTRYAKLMSEIYNKIIYKMEFIIQDNLGNIIDAVKTVKAFGCHYFSRIIDEYFNGNGCL